MATTNGDADVIVVGGGLAGLATAAYLARAGRSVQLFERSSALGGRALTQSKGGFDFNLGPHALYRKGQGAAILAELGVSFHGAPPAVGGGYAVQDGRKHTLPGGFVSLLTTGLLGLPGKLETARLLGSLASFDPTPWQGVSVREWLERSVRHSSVRALLQALVRVSTYANDPARQSAGAALAQVQMALAGGVLYLDGGWQTLVDGLRRTAAAAGVGIVTGARVAAVEHDGAVRGVRLDDGTWFPAAAVVVAAGPTEAAALVAGDHGALHRWAREAVPVKAACLDVGLRRLPAARALFALGIDRPLYLSVHSAVARLAPADAATVHVAKYLPSDGANDPEADRQELEALLDLVQPGWRAVVVEQRFLPSMTVYHALVTAAAGGVAGRPGPVVPDIRGLYVVGDWVGGDGLLVDASLASARRAAELIGREAAAARAAAA